MLYEQTSKVMPVIHYLFWYFLYTGIVCTAHSGKRRCELDPSANWCPYPDPVAYSCDSMNLTQVPAIPPNTTCLRVRYNNITSLTHIEANVSNLKLLDLSHNHIHSLNGKAFSGLESLDTLLLSDNSINFTAVTNRSLFCGLALLDQLQIQNNVWQGIKKYWDDMIGCLQNLHVLHMDGLPNGKSLGNGFTEHSKLTHIHIYGGFDSINNSTFASFSKLKIEGLYIKSGKLRNITEYAFQPLQHLKILNLSNNVNLGLKKASKGWVGIPRSLEHLYIQRLVSSPSDPIWYYDYFFRHLNKTSLKTVWLDENNLLYLPPTLTDAFPKSLEAISLNCNRLQTLTNLMTSIPEFTNLTYLSIAIQTRMAFNYPCQDDNLYHKYILEDASNSMATKQAKSLNSECPINEISNHSLMLPGHLKVLNMKACLLLDEETFKSSVLCGSNLRYVDMSINLFLSLEGPHILHNHTSDNFLSLNMDYNVLKYIDPNLFINNTQKGMKISKMSFYGNLLGFQLNNSQRAKPIFINLPYLTHLNLGNNQIKETHFKEFENSFSIENLNLSYNSFRSLTFNIDQMTNLTELDLSYNLFAAINATERNTLDELAVKLKQQQKNLSVYFAGNPLACSCATYDFLKWVKSSGHQGHVILPNISLYECVYEPSGELMNVTTFFERHQVALVRYCRTQIYLLISGVITGLSTVLAVCTLCVYRHRWDIKYLLLSVREKYSKQLLHEDDPNLKYDAFVAYHQDDFSWVRNELMRNLEAPPFQTDIPGTRETKYFSLCLHHKDFIPGATIEDNIVESINKSRKTILVVSTHFVCSGWCDFELQMARLHSIDKGRNLIITIMLEPVPPSTMSKTLRRLIKDTSYIEWPFNPIYRPQFWEKLRTALHNAAPQTVLCECGRTMNKSQ